MLEIYLERLRGPDAEEESVSGGLAVTRFPAIVGRHPECQLCLEDASISRRHCLLFAMSNQIWVQDLGSSNGTYVNGQRLEEAQPLHDGDALRLAQVSFGVQLPMSLSLPAVKPGHALHSTIVIRKPRRVLVVDDNKDAADSLAFVLQAWGHEVVTAYDAPQALEAALGNAFDFMLVDLRLPGMDGYELAQQLRFQPGLEHATFVAVTGYGPPHRERPYDAAGFQHVLTKPVDPEELEKLLRR